MVDIKEKIAELLAAQLDSLTEGAEGSLSKEDVKGMLEVPQDKANGDYAFPCFRLAKLLRKAPPLIAKDVAAGIANEVLFEKVEQVNAYVNMFVSRREISEITLGAALAPDFGRSGEGEGKTVIVEYSSPNIAKPFHIGHIRTTIIGDSIYRLYDELGYKVVRLNHLGDYGTQFGKMIVAFRKWGNEDDLEKDPIKYLLHLYQKFHDEAKDDPSLDDRAREAFVKLEAGEEDEVRLWKKFSDLSLAEFNRVYDMLGISFDEYDGESFYSDKMQRFIDELAEKGLMHESRGANIVDLEEYGLGVAMITKSDGSTLYCTRDIATAVYRKEHYDFYKNIYVVATQQNLYFRQLKMILKLLGYDWEEDCIHVPFGMVSLENGQILSTRGGNVVFLEDVLNNAIDKTKEIIREKNPDASDEHVDEIAKEVGIGAVKFQELSNNRIKDYTFTWDKVLNFDGETGPYVQYTHARCASVLRKAGEETAAKAEQMILGKSGSEGSTTSAGAGEAIDLSYIEGDNAYELVKLIYAFPEVVRDAAYKYEPSIVTRHIIDIAQSYNRFYHDEHILVENEDEKLAKVALTIAAKNVIATGLGLLGIAAPDRM